MLATSNIARDNVSSYYNKYISKHKTAYLSKQTVSYSVIVYTHNAFQVNRVISTFLLFFRVFLILSNKFQEMLCYVFRKIAGSEDQQMLCENDFARIYL